MTKEELLKTVAKTFYKNKLHNGIRHDVKVTQIGIESQLPEYILEYILKICNAYEEYLTLCNIVSMTEILANIPELNIQEDSNTDLQDTNYVYSIIRSIM